MLKRSTVSLWLACGFVILLAIVPYATCGQSEDALELVSGALIKGVITDRTETAVTIQIKAGSRTLTRRYPMERVKSVTINGEKTVVEGQIAGENEEPTTGGVGAVSGIVQRSSEDIDALIDRLGRIPPDWFESTPLEYPRTLNLRWPEEPPLVWNYERNVEHYLWDIINTNAKRYRGGVRLMHHLLEVNQNSPNTLARIMNELGRMYFEFFKDYARAAFWWKQAGVERKDRFRDAPSGARLAECYLRLGNREMAIELLNALPLTYAVIKLWGELRETDKTLELCEAALQEGLEANQIYLLAGDACRMSERYDQALVFYERVLAVPMDAKHREQIERDQRRAAETVEVIRLFDTLDVPTLSNGTYQDKSYGYYGNVYIETRIDSGRIDALRVTSHSDKQYYHAIDATIERILQKQTVKGVDAISGATITSEALIRATAKALSQGVN